MQLSRLTQWTSYLKKEEGQVIVRVCSVKNIFITDTQLKKGKACWHCSLTLKYIIHIYCMCETKEED